MELLEDGEAVGEGAESDRGDAESFHSAELGDL